MEDAGVWGPEKESGLILVPSDDDGMMCEGDSCDGEDLLGLPEPEQAESPTAVGSGRLSRTPGGKDALLRMGWTKGNPASPASRVTSVRQGSHAAAQSWSPVGPTTPDPSLALPLAAASPTTPPHATADNPDTASVDDGSSAGVSNAPRAAAEEEDESRAERFGWAKKLLGDGPGDQALRLWPGGQEMGDSGGRRRGRLATRLYEEGDGASDEEGETRCQTGDDDDNNGQGAGELVSESNCEEEGGGGDGASVNASDCDDERDEGVVVDKEAASMADDSENESVSEQRSQSDGEIDRLNDSVESDSEIGEVDLADVCHEEAPAESSGGCVAGADPTAMSRRQGVIVPRLNLSALPAHSEPVDAGTESLGEEGGGGVSRCASETDDVDSGDSSSSANTSMNDGIGQGDDCGVDEDEASYSKGDSEQGDVVDPPSISEETSTDHQRPILSPIVDDAFRGFAPGHLCGDGTTTEEAETPALRPTAVESPWTEVRVSSAIPSVEKPHCVIEVAESGGDGSHAALSRECSSASERESSSDGASSVRTVLWECVGAALLPPRPSTVPQLELGSVSMALNSSGRSADADEEAATSVGSVGDRDVEGSALDRWLKRQSSTGSVAYKKDIETNDVTEAVEEEAATGPSNMDMGGGEGAMGWEEETEGGGVGVIVAAQAAAAASMLEGWHSRLGALEEAQRVSIAEAERTQRAFLRDAAGVLADLKVSTQSEVARVLGDVAEAVRSSQQDTRQVSMRRESSDGVKEAAREGVREGWGQAEGRLLAGVTEAVQAVMDESRRRRDEEPQTAPVAAPSNVEAGTVFVERAMAQVEAMLGESAAKVEAAAKESAERLAAAVAEAQAELGAMLAMRQATGVGDGVAEAVAEALSSVGLEGAGEGRVAEEEWRARMERELGRAVAAAEDTRDVVAGAQGTSAEALSQLADQLEASVQRANEAAETLIAVSADSERTRSAAERHPSTGEQSELILEGLQAVQATIRMLEESLLRWQKTSSGVEAGEGGQSSGENVAALRAIERATLGATVAAEQAGASAVKAAEAAGVAQQVVADAAEMVVTASKSLQRVMLETSDATKRVVHQAAQAILTTTDAAVQIVSDSRNASFSTSYTPDDSFDATVHSQNDLRVASESAPSVAPSPSKPTTPHPQWQPTALSQPPEPHHYPHYSTAHDAADDDVITPVNSHPVPASKSPPAVQAVEQSRTPSSARRDKSDRDLYVESHPISDDGICSSCRRAADVRTSQPRMASSDGGEREAQLDRTPIDDGSHHQRRRFASTAGNLETSPTGSSQHTSSSSCASKKGARCGRGDRHANARTYSEENSTNGSNDDDDSDDSSVSVSRRGRERVSSMLVNSRRVVEGLGKKNREQRRHSGVKASLVFSDSESDDDDDDVVLSFAARRWNGTDSSRQSMRTVEDATKPRPRVSLPPPLPLRIAATPSSHSRESSSVRGGLNPLPRKESERTTTEWRAAEEAAIAAAASPLSRSTTPAITNRAAIGDFLDSLSRSKKPAERPSPRSDDDDSEDDDEALFIAAKRYALNRHCEEGFGSFRRSGYGNSTAPSRGSRDLSRTVNEALHSSRVASSKYGATEWRGDGEGSDDGSDDDGEYEYLFTNLRRTSGRARA